MTGKLITFEGIDGSGTTTQARLMFEALVDANVPVHLTQEPSHGPVGSLIRQVLTGRVVSPGRTGSHRPGWQTMGLLFAADRLDHLECEILPNLQDGIHVISDRYLHSSIVYQSATADREDAGPWLVEINRNAIQPDLVIFLEVQPDVALMRRTERRTTVEMYDDPELQEKIAREYEELYKTVSGVSVARIDGTGSERDVNALCMRWLKELTGIP